MIEQLQGREYWMSLEHLAGSQEIDQRMRDEFTDYDPQTIQSMNRRGFLKIMGASMALAGLTLSGCRYWPRQYVVPQNTRPEGYKPGEPEFYATMMELGGVAYPLLAKCIDGRPIKIDGNKLAQGFSGSSVWAQASLLNLYDPDRTNFKAPQYRVKPGPDATGQPRRWSEAVDALQKAAEEAEGSQGEGFVVVSEASSSPTVMRLRKELKKKLPQMRWVTWEPMPRQTSNTAEAIAKAEIVACFDCDLLGSHPLAQANANAWAKNRRSVDEGQMSRMYVAEGSHTITGAAADQRLAIKPSRVGLLLQVLAKEKTAEQASLSESEKKFATALAEDISSRKTCIFVGDSQPKWVRDLALTLSNNLTNLTGESLAVGVPGASDVPDNASTVVVLGGNPLFDAPAGITNLISNADQSFHLSQEMNETSVGVNWALPRAHFLECWGDGIDPRTNRVMIQQPMIKPLLESTDREQGRRSAIELLSILLGSRDDDYAQVRKTLAADVKPRDWQQALHDGYYATPPVPDLVGSQNLSRLQRAADTSPIEGMEIAFITDASIMDGRFANNGWLQEMPDPMSKLTWDNCLYISKQDADQLGVATGDMVKVTVGSESLEVPAYIMPGQAPGCVTAPLGYGRTVCGNVGINVGFNFYPLKNAAGASIAACKVEKAQGKHNLVSTQDHYLIDDVGMWGREKRVGKPEKSGYVIREAPFDKYKKNPYAPHKDQHGNVNLPLFAAPLQEKWDEKADELKTEGHPDPRKAFNDPHAWGMAIDMNSCTGCNSCVIACQAENNVPVTGKDMVANSREMHWLRIDRYFKGNIDDPDSMEVVNQPMMCVHCENAPCEQVCPVAATMHDTEGLNVMVYNRCIGTRYCGNNCSYKVRRFNYFDYQSKDPRGAAQPWLGIPDTQQNEVIDDIKKMMFNPQVTVRMRGVMEKCTYCVQRINAAKINAKKEFADGKRPNDLVQEGEVITACQEACPTEAIIFGNLNDPKSQVSRIHRNNRAYEVLGESNSRPRSKHLAKIRNPKYPRNKTTEETNSH